MIKLLQRRDTRQNLGPGKRRQNDVPLNLGHRLPFVDGTPLTRGSGSTAERSARASALNCASTI